MHTSCETIGGGTAPGTDRIFLYPLSLDDEVHVSQAGRFHVDSGNGTTRKSFEQLYDSVPFRHTNWIPPHLERFARKLPGSTTENIETLLRSNTLFPLFEIFGNATLSLSADAIPIAQQILNMPKRIVGESGKIQLCFDCLQGDTKEHGLPYIHRSHQIPGVNTCWNHGSRLLSCCPFCGCPFERTEISDLVLAPWKPCECGRYLPDATFWRPERDAGEVELDFARFAHDLLVSSSQHLSASVLAALYKKRIAELGLTRKSQIDRLGMIAELEKHFGIELLAKIDTAYRTGKNQHWFRMGSESGVFDVPMARHLALAHFLFRRASLFWTAASSTLTELAAQKASQAIAPPEKMKDAVSKKPVAPSSESGNVIANNDDHLLSPEKRKVKEVLERHTGWTIEDLWRKQPGVMRKLLRKNTDGLAWLNERLNAKPATQKSRHSPSAHDQGNDLHWAKKFIEIATAEYSSIALPTKATCNYLMRKAGWKNTNKPNSRQFPLARKTLESLAESQWHYYARRILWAKLTIGDSATSRSSVILPSGIENHRGKDLLVYFAEVPATRGLKNDSIMQILDARGISKSWEGLSPSPKYYVPGRNYVAKRNASRHKL